MRITSGLTQIATETDYETENDIEQQELILKSNEDKGDICQNIKYKLICIVFSIIIVFIFCAIVIGCISVILETNEASMNEEHALLVIEDLMQLNISYNYFNDDEKEEYIHAFNVFDKDGDKSLNKTEFITYFKLQLNKWAIFERIDVNADDILSFAECVSYLHEINKINEVHIDLILTITQQLIIQYGVEFDEKELDSLFLQYAAIFLYFEEFDYDLNGFIDKNDYLSISAQNQFNAIDRNQDYKITPDELSIVLYGDLSTMDSWTSKLKNIFGDNYKNVMQSLKTIKATPEIVESVSQNLQISPFDINLIMNKMQRNNSKDANKEHICFRNNYCYFSYFGEDTKDTKHIYYPPIQHEIIDAIYPDNILNIEEIERIKEAENICNQQNCCREDDDKLYLSDINTQPSQSQCTNFDYLECLSNENECVWDCLLPQNNENGIHFKRIFKGIDRHIAYKIEHPQTTTDKEQTSSNEINMDYLSLDAMDECGTVYEYQLTNDSIQKEYDNIINKRYHKQAVDGSEADGRRRLHSVSTCGEMNEKMRRKLGVLGTDGRVDVTQFASPWNKNVFFFFETNEGTMRCSGSMISPRHVLTAGHCVSDGSGNYFWDFKVYPAYNVGNTETYFTPSNVVAFRGWHYHGDWNWDMAIITLKTTDTGYGWFSFGYNDDISTLDWFGVTGYPVDKGEILQHQWMQMDYKIFYDVLVTQTGDIVGGNSGGPTWIRQSQVVYGVVSHETWTGYRPKVYLHNGMTRITPEKYATICAYLQGFPETVDHC